MEYACETGILTDNPLGHVRWTRPRATTGSRSERRDQPRPSRTVSRRCRSGRGTRSPPQGLLRLHVLRRAPARRGDRASTVQPHPARRARPVGRDAAHRSSAPLRQQLDQHRRDPRTGPLKHRADGEARRVPIHPELVEILQAHLAEFGPTDPDGRLFVGAHAGPVTDRTYLRVFHRARTAAFTAEEAASPLMEVPYALRHAAVSTWLRTTGDAALVARWAGHSVAGPTEGLRQDRRRHRAGVPRPHLERDTPTPRRTRLQGHK